MRSKLKGLMAALFAITMLPVAVYAGNPITSVSIEELTSTKSGDFTIISGKLQATFSKNSLPVNWMVAADGDGVSSAIGNSLHSGSVRNGDRLNKAFSFKAKTSKIHKRDGLNVIVKARVTSTRTGSMMTAQSQIKLTNNEVVKNEMSELMLLSDLSTCPKPTVGTECEVRIRLQGTWHQSNPEATVQVVAVKAGDRVNGWRHNTFDMSKGKWQSVKLMFAPNPDAGGKYYMDQRQFNVQVVGADDNEYKIGKNNGSVLTVVNIAPKPAPVATAHVEEEETHTPSAPVSAPAVQASVGGMEGEGDAGIDSGDFTLTCENCTSGQVLQAGNTDARLIIDLRAEYTGSGQVPSTVELHDNGAPTSFSISTVPGSIKVNGKVMTGQMAISSTSNSLGEYTIPYAVKWGDQWEMGSFTFLLGGVIEHVPSQIDSKNGMRLLVELVRKPTSDVKVVASLSDEDKQNGLSIVEGHDILTFNNEMRYGVVRVKYTGTKDNAKIGKVKLAIHSAHANDYPAEDVYVDVVKGNVAKPVEPSMPTCTPSETAKCVYADQMVVSEKVEHEGYKRAIQLKDWHQSNSRVIAVPVSKDLSTTIKFKCLAADEGECESPSYVATSFPDQVQQHLAEQIGLHLRCGAVNLLKDVTEIASGETEEFTVGDDIDHDYVNIVHCTASSSAPFSIHANTVRNAMTDTATQ